MDKRDEFLRMLRDCRKGKIDRIITKSVSRFARNTKECLSVIRELKELGITIMFEKEGIDTANISDEMMITIMGGLAQEESTSISNNLRWSIKRKMQNGTYILPHIPFGYYMNNNKIEINEDEAEIVRYIFNSYLSGKGINSIVKDLNDKDISLTIKNWTYISVRYILLNEKYVGDSLWHKFCTTQTLPYRTIVNNGIEDKYYIKCTHPAIITKEVYNKVQLLFSKRAFKMNKHNKILSKMIVCGNCGALFKQKKNNNIYYWVCITHTTNIKKCSQKQIPEEKFYDAFIRIYNKLKSHYSSLFPPLLSQLQDLKNKKHTGNQQYMEIQKETAKLKEQLHVLARLKTKGFIDDEKYITQSTELSAKIEKLNDELRKLSQADDEDDVIDRISEIADIIENGTDLMTQFDEVMFESLVEKIIVMKPNTLEFHLYGGLRFTEKIK